MQKLFTYKQFLATAFLLLYIFIATPTQLWHHHAASQAKAVEVKISKTTGAGLQTEGCKICQHTYAAYFAEEVSYNFAISNIEAVKNSFFKTNYSSTSLFNLSNKSPPLV